MEASKNKIKPKTAKKRGKKNAKCFALERIVFARYFCIKDKKIEEQMDRQMEGGFSSVEKGERFERLNEAGMIVKARERAMLL